MSSTDSTMLNLALSYHARDWPVFPSRAGEEIDEHTGEVYQPKTPYTPNGLRGASKTERIIREWWRRTPTAMVAVPTGAPIDAWVLDLDVKPGVGDGHDWLAEMEAEHGQLPQTARSKTMGGGTHIFFKHVAGVRNRGKLGLCVDVRGDGGYIIAPGSVTADGRAYQWIDESPIAEAPQWLLDLVLPSVVAERHHDYTPNDYSYTPSGNAAYVERAVQDELEALARTGPGGRGYQLNASAFSLGTLVGAGALSRQEAEAGLWQAAMACGIAAKDGERETRAKIRRGLDAGQQKPRDIPEPTYHNNDNTRLVDVTRLLENAKKKSERAASEDDAPPSIESPTAEETPPAAFRATPFEWINPASLPRREFVFGNHYIRKFVGVTVSPGGLGKTSNSIVEALSMCSGRMLTGSKPPAKMRVWLFNAEDPRDEMDRRIMAACLHYRLKPSDLTDRLFMDTGREQELVIMREDKRTGVRLNEPVVDAIASQILENDIDVMIVDPFVSTHQVNENDNGAIDKVAKLWAQIADHTNCSIDIVHHLRKIADREATVEDARGAVSLIGAARSVRVLNRMSEEQATAAGVSSADRFSYFQISQGKANLTRMDTSQQWRKLESVALGNGRGLQEPQDFAGVVTEWKWPSSEEVADGLTAGQINDIKSTLAAGAYKKAAQARDNWAGCAIAYALGFDVTDKPGKARAGSILKALIAEGVLTEINERDPISRALATFIRPAT